MRRKVEPAFLQFSCLPAVALAKAGHSERVEESLDALFLFVWNIASCISWSFPFAQFCIGLQNAVAISASSTFFFGLLLVATTDTPYA